MLYTPFYSKDNQREPEQHLGTQKALERHLDTRSRTYRALKLLGTPRAVGHSVTQGTWSLGTRGTRGTLFSRIQLQRTMKSLNEMNKNSV